MNTDRKRGTEHSARGTQHSALSTQHSGLSAPLDHALTSSVALLAGLYIVVRPVANQFAPYSGDAAFAGMVAVLLFLCTGFKALLGKRPCCVPDKLTAAALLWLGLFLYGVLRSPNLGVAIPLGCDAAIYIALLFCGYFMARREPALAGILARVLVAMVVVEAIAAVGQHFADLPAMWDDARAQPELLPESLKSTTGQFRLFGDEVFGTFGNPNLLAAYLLVGLWLLAGLCWRPAGCQPLRKSTRVLGVVLFVFMCAALYFTRSKAGALACLAGAWFFAAQQMSLKSPQRRRALAGLTIAGLVLILVYLALGTSGLCWAPRSLAVRFEYWKAALKMIAAHPCSGLGLGGFAEHYPFFKTPLGGETREAHNDYLHLWAELGVLGPLLYLSLWALVLRALGGARSTGVSPVHTTGTAVPRESTGASPIFRESKSLENWAICGGVAGFLVMYCAFSSFNSADVISLLNGKVNAQTLCSTFHTLALPLIFISVVVGLRPAPLTPPSPPWGEGRVRGAAELTTWTHGLRAAIGAVLVHELVDFDFKAQAVIGGLFLVAGMFWALREPVETDSDSPCATDMPPQRGGLSVLPAAGTDEVAPNNRRGHIRGTRHDGVRTSDSARPTPLGQLSRVLLPALVVPLFYGAAWVPLRAGTARAAAEAAEDEARALARERPAKGTPFEYSKEYREKRHEVARLRAAVVEAAPFDGNAWFELAGACEAMQRAWQSHSMRGEILSYLAEGESLRPVSPAAKLMYGDFYFRSAMRALRFRDKPGKDFELAMTAYGEAAARYPLAPGFRILTGDAALMQGETQAAAAQYMQALRTDVLINDLDVCLSSIFTDPRPGAAARHGFDGEILERLGATPLTLPSPQGGEGGVRGAGLLVRRLLATATLLNEDKRSHALDSALAGQHRAEMLQTGQELPQMLEELPLRAHAALFHALTFELAGDAPAAAKAAAWEQACKLQDESVQQGKPGTVPYLFYVLDLWYRQGKR